jgi:hypothetical protein
MPGFKDLINEHKHRAQDPHAVAQPKQRLRGKSADPNYSKVTIYLSNQILQDAKIEALKQGRDLSDIAEELFTKWLDA